jgi:uracil-DNA glycosylase
LILRRLAAALAAVVGAVIVCIGAAALALYAVARLWLTPAGAAAVVAVAFALVAAAAAALALRKAPLPPRSATEEVPLLDQLIAMAKARPLVALGAAAAAVTVLIRNPAVVSAIVGAFMAGGAQGQGKPETK